MSHRVTPAPLTSGTVRQHLLSAASELDRLQVALDHALADRQQHLRENKLLEQEADRYVRLLLDRQDLQLRNVALEEELAALRIANKAIQAMQEAAQGGSVEIFGHHDGGGWSWRVVTYRHDAPANAAHLVFDGQATTAPVPASRTFEREGLIDALLAINGQDARKKCGRCGLRKRLQEFSPNPGRPDGRYSACKKCHAKHMRESDRKRMDPKEVLPLFSGSMSPEQMERAKKVVGA